MKKSVVLILIGALVCGMLTNVLAAGKDTLVVGLQDVALTFDPANHRDRVTETLCRNIFDGLVTRTVKMEIVPEIAESWTWIDDKTCEFKIRKGIKFHNGEPCTAEDVEYTFNRIIKEGGMDGESSPRKGLLGPLEDVKMVDDYTVRFYLSSPWPVLLKMLPHQQIVPKDYLEKVRTSEFRKHPIGCGPFKFVEGEPGSRVVLERFDEYYGGSPDIPPVGLAKVKRVIFEVIPETSTRIAALQTGECDIIQWVPAELIPVLDKDPNCVVKYAAGTRSHMMEMNVTKPPFDDVRVRKAMNYAIDVDLLVEKIFGGRGTVFAGVCFPYEEMNDPFLKPYGYNPELAKKLLKQAGYPNGFSVTLDVTGEWKELGEVIAGMLSDVGIKCSVRVWDWGVLKPLLLKGERKLDFSTWGSSILDPIGYLDAKLPTKGRSNYSQYSNPRVDELMAKGGVTVDPEERKKIYIEIQRIVYEDCPWVFGFTRDEVLACRANVRNWEPSPDGRINLHDVWKE